MFRHTAEELIAALGKPITLIGIAFSSKKRAVSGAKIARDA